MGDGQSREARDGTDLIRAGLAVGAIGLVGAVTGAVCPVCLVATPALLGAGAVRRWRAHRTKLDEEAR